MPPQRSGLAAHAAYLDRGGVLIAEQADITGVHSEHPAIASIGRDVNFVQASRGIAMNRFVAAAKIIEMQGDELRSGNREIKCKLLGGSK